MIRSLRGRPQFAAAHVGENHQPQLLFRDEGDQRAHPVNVAAVLDDLSPAVIGEKPAKAVSDEVGFGK